jgi:hypothetical protein
MISWGVIGYGAVLSALLAGLLVAAATRARRLPVLNHLRTFVVSLGRMWTSGCSVLRAAAPTGRRLGRGRASGKVRVS